MISSEKFPAKDVPRDVMWFFSPFFTWMGILGINLHPENKRHFYCYLVLLVGLWSNIDVYTDACLKLMFTNESSNGLNATTSTDSWNIMIDFSNHFFFIVGVHSVLFYVSRQHWPNLWIVIQKLNYRESSTLGFWCSRNQLLICAAPVIYVRNISRPIRTKCWR